MSVKVSKSTLRGWIKSVKDRAEAGRLPSLAQRQEEIERVEDRDPLAGAPAPEPARKSATPPIQFFRPEDASKGRSSPGSGSPYGFTDAKAAIDALVHTVPGSGELSQLESEVDVRLHKRFQYLNDGLAFLSVMKAARGQMVDLRGSKAYAELRAIGGQLARKILYSSYTGFGAEFIPNTLSASLITLFRESRRVAASFETINLPTSPYKFPVQGADTLAYKVAENTSDDPNALAQANYIPSVTPATSSVTFTAGGLKVRGLVSAEAEEDSIISMVDYLRGILVQAEIDALETTIINGDTTGSHQDSDVTASTDCRKLFSGLRKLTTAAAKLNVGGTKMDVGDILTARTKMGKFASDPANCGIYLSQIGLTHLVGDSSFLTAEKAGPGFTLLSGAIGSLLGMPVFTSGFIREDLGPAGVYSASVNRTHCLVVHRPSFKIGARRGLTLASTFDIESDRHVLVATMRVDFQRVQAEVTSGSNKAYNCVNLYNIDRAGTF